MAAWLMATRAQAVSIRQTALSGNWRLGMKRADRRTASTDGFIENADLVVRLQRADEAADHRDGQRLAWLLDLNHLKTPRQRRIFFEVLLILGPGGRRDRAQFAAGKRRLQQIGGIALSG